MLILFLFLSVLCKGHLKIFCGIINSQEKLLTETVTKLFNYTKETKNWKLGVLRCSTWLLLRSWLIPQGNLQVLEQNFLDAGEKLWLENSVLGARIEPEIKTSLCAYAFKYSWINLKRISQPWPNSLILTSKDQVSPQ